MSTMRASDIDLAADQAWVRGYVAAVAEFARRETTPKRVLAAARITRERAAQCKVYPMDMIELRRQWAPAEKVRRP